MPPECYIGFLQGTKLALRDPTWLKSIAEALKKRPEKLYLFTQNVKPWFLTPLPHVILILHSSFNPKGHQQMPQNRTLPKIIAMSAQSVTGEGQGRPRKQFSLTQFQNVSKTDPEWIVVWGSWLQCWPLKPTMSDKWESLPKYSKNTPKMTPKVSQSDTLAKYYNWNLFGEPQFVNWNLFGEPQFANWN